MSRQLRADSSLPHADNVTPQETTVFRPFTVPLTQRTTQRLTHLKLRQAAKGDADENAYRRPSPMTATHSSPLVPEPNEALIDAGHLARTADHLPRVAFTHLSVPNHTRLPNPPNPIERRTEPRFRTN